MYLKTSQINHSHGHKQILETNKCYFLNYRDRKKNEHNKEIKNLIIAHRLP